MTASVRRALRLEHRLTQPNASLADLDAAVALAAEHELAALTVNPWLVKAAKRSARALARHARDGRSAIPHGSQLLSVKAFEASKALEQGATQIDFVLNGGALASGDDETVFNDMLAVIDMAHSALASAGVIVEPEPLAEDLVRRACRLAERAGADYVVTSDGAGSAAATLRGHAAAARQRGTAHRGQGLRPLPHARTSLPEAVGRRRDADARRCLTHVAWRARRRRARPRPPAPRRSRHRRSVD